MGVSTWQIIEKLLEICRVTYYKTHLYVSMSLVLNPSFYTKLNFISFDAELIIIWNFSLFKDKKKFLAKLHKFK